MCSRNSQRKDIETAAMNPQTLIHFLNLVEPMKYHTRHSWTSTGRQESVAEHSWRLSLMAYLVKDEFPKADISKVILMCICHDLGEAVTGDIPAFLKTEENRETETSAVHTLLSTLPEPYQSELMDLFFEMEEQKTLESHIYKALDKMECLVQHNEAPISTWLPLEYEQNLTYGAEQVAFSDYMKHLRKLINQESLDKEKREKGELL